jgi:hypothetical protein
VAQTIAAAAASGGWMFICKTGKEKEEEELEPVITHGEKFHRRHVAFEKLALPNRRRDGG